MSTENYRHGIILAYTAQLLSTAVVSGGLSTSMDAQTRTQHISVWYIW